MATLPLFWVFAILATDLVAQAGANSMSEEEQMARLADAVYAFHTPVADWTLAHALQLTSRWTGEPDNFAIYVNSAERRCALAVAGTNSPFDTTDNLDGRLVEACGFVDVHSGYMGEVNDLFPHCVFQNQFLPLLQSSKCSGGIAAVGHSLGGGVASILAAC